MEFLILIGFLLTVTMIAIKNRLFFEENIDYDSCDVDIQKQAAKANKFFWNLFFWVGIVVLLFGIIGTICL